MRYVIYGAGAIGATIGARLHAAGRDVALIARGAHLDALRADGLTFHEPTGTSTVRVRAVGDPAEIAWHDDTVVVLAMKSQDTAGAVAALAAEAPTATPVICAQNGLANEAMALRCLPVVYGAHVVVAADHLEPGVVARFGTPFVGLVDIGRFPTDASDDPVGQAIVEDLVDAGFRSRLDPQIMAAKARKLYSNLRNAIEALVGTRGAGELDAAVGDEAEAVFAAAGITMVPAAAHRARLEGLSTVAAGDIARVGGSTKQSLLRGLGSIETDYLNGEIALLGRLHGVPTPVNAILQRQASIAARRRLPPGAIELADLLAMVAAERDGLADGDR